MAFTRLHLCWPPCAYAGVQPPCNGCTLELPAARGTQDAPVHKLPLLVVLYGDRERAPAAAARWRGAAKQRGWAVLSLQCPVDQGPRCRSIFGPRPLVPYRVMRIVTRAWLPCSWPRWLSTPSCPRSRPGCLGDALIERAEVDRHTVAGPLELVVDSRRPISTHPLAKWRRSFLGLAPPSADEGHHRGGESRWASDSATAIGALEVLADLGSVPAPAPGVRG